MEFKLHNGGRPQGTPTKSRDCVIRAIATVTGLPYELIHLGVAEACEVPLARIQKLGTPVWHKGFKKYMERLGFKWTATMSIGSGCKVHLRADQLPTGRLIASVSRHWVAVIDGVAYDTNDPRRGGRRCVYGYWTREAK